MQKEIKVSQESIIAGLKALGVVSGMELEVHSSLGSFGYVTGGAETVIAALKETVGPGGSIFMPALRLSPELPLTEQDRALGIMTKIKLLPVDCERSAMGVIADTFRRSPGTYLSEGVFRTAAWGRSAEQVISGGLSYLIENGGKALLLGVDIYKLTAMHYVENNMPEDISAIFAPSEAVNQIYPPNEWLIETGAPPVKAWYTIQAMAFERGLIRAGTIGNSRIMFFDIREVVGLYERELKSNPYKLYGLARD